MRDWFRKTSWSNADSEDFERRLARARPASRPQYLRIQAVHLFETGKKGLIAVASALAARVISEYDDKIQTGPAHHLLGLCRESQGDLLAALAEFRAAVALEKKRPSVETDAYLDFAWLVARHGSVEHFAEAMDFLTRFHDRPVFATQRYRYHGALALLANARGDSAAAGAAARVALDARERSSPFSAHGALRRFRPSSGDTHQRLKRIAK